MLFHYKLDKERFKEEKNNDEFVDYSFYRFDKSELRDGSTNEQSDETINKWVEQAYKHCIENPDSFYHVACGNAIVIGLPYEDEIQIVVATNYDEYTINLD